MTGIKKVIFFVLLAKILFFAAVYIGYKSFSFDTETFSANLVYPKEQGISPSTTFNTWDSQHYYLLSDKGYGVNPMSDAFYPLYPTLIKLFRPVFLGNTVLTGVVLSNIFSIIGMLFLYLLVLKLFKSQTAFKTVLLFSAFPTAFHMNIMYSEALFLMLVFGFFYYIYNNKFMPAVIFALLLPISRPQGILLLAPLVVFILIKHKYKFLRVLKAKENFIIGAFILGWFGYFFFMYNETGSFFAGFEAQKLYVAQSSIWNILRIDQWFIGNFVNLEFSLHGYTNSIIDRSFFIIYLIMLYYIYKKTNKVLFVFALFMGLIPALSDHFMSYTRLLLPVFPMFIALGKVIKEKTAYVIAVLLFLVQIVFAVRHCLGYWVA